MDQTHLAFSPQFTAAVESKQVAQQEAERSKWVVEKALEEKKSIVIQAQGEAEAAKMIASAIANNPGRPPPKKSQTPNTTPRPESRFPPLLLSCRVEHSFSPSPPPQLFAAHARRSPACTGGVVAVVEEDVRAQRTEGERGGAWAGARAGFIELREIQYAKEVAETIAQSDFKVCNGVVCGLWGVKRRVLRRVQWGSRCAAACGRRERTPSQA